MAAEPIRHAAVDGRLPDLDGEAPVSLVPLVSDNWTKHFKWRGTGKLTGDEKAKLQAVVARAHRQGRKVRFWAAPDHPAGWTELRAAGVDLLNSDRLSELGSFLETHRAPPAP